MNHKTFLIALAILAIHSADATANVLPKFEDYPATSTSKCQNVTVNLKSHPEAHTFRTQLREAAKRHCPEFAGHYIVAAWGCGSPCQEGALIDVRSGQVYKLPFLLRTGAAYYPDSTLFEINPNPGTLFETEWWVWQQNQFRKVVTSDKE